MVEESGGLGRRESSQKSQGMQMELKIISSISVFSNVM
jgi:hypothetical protein